MMKSSFMCVAVVMSLAVAGGTVTWNPAGSGTWADDSRWIGGVPPSSGDTVNFNACTGLVTVADAATLANIAKITLTGEGSGLVISNDVADGDFTFSKPVSGDGVLVKQGGGTTLMTYVETKEKSGYWMAGGLEVLDGTLILPRSPSQDLYLAKVTVMDPGVFVHTGVKYTRILGGLWGTGVVSNDLHKPLYISGGTAENPAVFGGRFVHKAYPCTTPGNSVNVVQYFTGTESDNGQQVLNYTQDGTIGFYKFGTSGVNGGRSSVGTVSQPIAYRGLRNRIVYLGEGETTDREIQYGTSAQDGTLDAGEHGGLTLSGKFGIYSTECNMMNVLTLTGNGENVFNATYSSVTNPQGRYVSHYLVKDGNGSWRFTSGKTRSMIGTVEVKKGELRFDSIAERGTNCALGPANLTQSRYYGTFATAKPEKRAIDDSKTVPYAFLLGNGTDAPDAEHLATLAYTGTADAEVHTRAIVLNGAGRLKTGDARLIWDGVTASTSGVHTLVAEVGNAPLALTVTNGPGTVSMVKEGAGLCLLDRESDLTGELAVKGGTLRFTGRKYGWYRFTVTESWNGATNAAGEKIAGGSGGGSLVFCQLALRDATSANQALHLVHNKSADAKPWLLAPGEAAIGVAAYRFLGGTDYKRDVEYALSNLFENADTYIGVIKRTDDMSSDNGYTGFNTPSNRYMSFVMRLPDTATPVTHYDIKWPTYWPREDVTVLRTPRAWTMEGSPDGVTWDLLDTVTTNDNTYANIVTGGYGRWYFNNSTTAGAGYELSGTERAGAAAAAHPASVSAAAGATLEAMDGDLAADGIHYGAGGAGTISGVTFTENARVYLDEIAEEQLGALLPVSFVNCSGFDDRRWKVVVNGVLRGGYYAKVDATGIRVSRPGLYINLK